MITAETSDKVLPLSVSDRKSKLQQFPILDAPVAEDRSENNNYTLEQLH